MPLLYIRCKNVILITDLLLEKEDKEVEKIEGYNNCKGKNSLLLILYKLVLEDSK